MLSVVVILKGLAEFAGLLLIAQGLVFLLSFGRHEINPIYRALKFLTSPVVKGVRAITPAVVVDKHVPAVALFLLIVAWFLLVIAKAMLGAVPNA